MSVKHKGRDSDLTIQCASVSITVLLSSKESAAKWLNTLNCFHQNQQQQRIGAETDHYNVLGGSLRLNDDDGNERLGGKEDTHT